MNLQYISADNGFAFSQMNLWNELESRKEGKACVNILHSIRGMQQHPCALPLSMSNKMPEWGQFPCQHPLC